jgi:hypothetical protein
MVSGASMHALAVLGSTNTPQGLLDESPWRNKRALDHTAHKSPPPHASAVTPRDDVPTWDHAWALERNASNTSQVSQLSLPRDSMSPISHAGEMGWGVGGGARHAGGQKEGQASPLGGGQAGSGFFEHLRLVAKMEYERGVDTEGHDGKGCGANCANCFPASDFRKGLAALRTPKSRSPQ